MENQIHILTQKKTKKKTKKKKHICTYSNIHIVMGKFILVVDKSNSHLNSPFISTILPFSHTAYSMSLPA